MIISHKHKFIFIKTKKTAGSSIQMALSGICGPEDIITPNSEIEEVKKRDLGLRNAQNYSLEDNPACKKNIPFKKDEAFYSHMPAKRLCSILREEIWNTYYKFCFERNPFDKAISFYYYYIQRHGLDLSLSDFIKSGYLHHIRGYERYTMNSLVVVDRIYKYENLGSAMQHISKKLQIDPTIKLPDYKAKSQFRMKDTHYSKMLSTEDIEIIKLTFAREIQLLGYAFS